MCTACGSTEFLSAPCTPTTDTACTTCASECAAETFEVAPCGPFNDLMCNACTPPCAAESFEATPCGPLGDRTCTICTLPCAAGTFEVAPCGPISDRMCAACTPCAATQYEVTACGGTQDTVCTSCEVGCAACTGPGPSCTSCELGFVLELGACVPVPPAMCGNAVVELLEGCDDGNLNNGDGCSDLCIVEPDHYCFGEAPSLCRPGACAFEAATSLPLGPAFAIDGTATTSAAGLTFSQRSTVHTTADLSYPVVIEADVTYSAADITFVGTRGTGLRDPLAADEPTDSLRARLSTTVELATGPGVTVIASTPATFVPTLGVPYRVRFVDDGTTAEVVWFNLTNLSEGVALAMPSSFHGGADRAFLGGGDQGGLTVANVRVCSAPSLPITAGLAAHYTAVPSWTAIRDLANKVSQWQDLSGNANHLNYLDVSGVRPAFAPGLINGHVGLDFTGGARLITSPFELTTDVTVFAVIQHRTPAQWGAIAHHGSRDNDWSMEQSGFSGSNDVLHWQTNNDNTNVDLMLVQDTSYVMTGRFDGNARHFSATTFSGTPPAPVEIVDASHTITAGSRPLYVGSSDNNEASNAFIGELVYYSRALSDAERDVVIDYLRDNWRPW